MEPLDLVADGLREMGLAQSYPTIDHQGVEGVGARFFRYRLSGPTCHPITVPLDKGAEGVYRVELSVDLHLLQPGNHKGILNWVVYNKRKIHFVVGKRFIAMSRDIHG